MSSCILCGLQIVKNTDKNLVDGRRGNTFNVREELLSLEFNLEIDSLYICRNCLSALKTQRGLVMNLQEANSTIQKIAYAKSFSISSPVRVNAPSSSQLSSSQEQTAKLVALEQRRSSVNLQEDGFALFSSTLGDHPLALTSTPCKEKNRPVALPVFGIPVAPNLDCKVAEEKKTQVRVTVEWPSQTKVNTLHKGLESLGKMLCRRTYKQIALLYKQIALLFFIRSSYMVHFVYHFIIDSFLTGTLEPTNDQLPTPVAS